MAPSENRDFEGGGGGLVWYVIGAWTLGVFACRWNILGCPRILPGPGHETPNKPQGFEWVRIPLSWMACKSSHQSSDMC